MCPLVIGEFRRLHVYPGGDVHPPWLRAHTICNWTLHTSSNTAKAWLASQVSWTSGFQCIAPLPNPSVLEDANTSSSMLFWRLWFSRNGVSRKLVHSRKDYSQWTIWRTIINKFYLINFNRGAAESLYFIYWISTRVGYRVFIYTDDIYFVCISIFPNI